MDQETEFPRCSRAAHWLGVAVMKATGWKVAGSPPNTSRMLIIAAPHTTNWDLIYLLGAAYTLELSINWLGKDSLFKSVLGPILRFVGGLPVDRSRPNNLVKQLAEDINNRDGCAIVVPPSGTRKYTPYWKSGFYWIAVEANIPLVCGYLDYKHKVAGLGLTFIPSGDIPADMDRIRAFYADKNARYPAQKSLIRLKEE